MQAKPLDKWSGFCSRFRLVISLGVYTSDTLYRKGGKAGGKEAMSKTAEKSAKNWQMYTKREKRGKSLKKGLPKGLECGIICERQALSEKNDFWKLSRKPLKRTNRR